jgi:hypothetical protein
MLNSNFNIFIMHYLLPILALTALCAGWMGVQLLAKRLGTKNHIDRKASDGCCGQCGGEGCAYEA